MSTTRYFMNQESEAAWRKLTASAEYALCLESLKGKDRRPGMWAGTLEDWIGGAVMHGLAELEPFEKMTSKQRQEASKRMVVHCEALRELLIPFYDEKSGLDWPFQPDLDWLLSTARSTTGLPIRVISRLLTKMKERTRSTGFGSPSITGSRWT